jgi:predicted Zn-dependent peptidase
MFNVEKKVLDNGLRVVLVPMENSEAVTIQILVNVGSNNETKEINGISHFLEHLFFKGTKNRPNPGDIHKELDRIGASHNAFTTKELTGFWVKSSVKDFDISFDIISDLFLNPLFNEEEIEKERGVILQEINMYEDMPQQKVLRSLIGVMYGDQSMGWETLGTKKSVGKIHKKDILKYRNSNYTLSDSMIIVSGGIDKYSAFEKIKSAFSETKKENGDNKFKFSDYQLEPKVKIFNKKIDQSHFILGIKAFDMFDEKRYIISVLSTILGEKSSSRLFMEIREKLGLAYYVGSMTWLLSKTGIFFIRAGVSHDNLEKTVNKIMEIVGDLKSNGVTEKELKDAKSFLRGQTALSLETSDQVADFFGEQELFYGKIMQPEEILEKIEKVTQDDILKIAQEIFKPEKISMAVIGSHPDFSQKEEFYKNLFSKI